MTVARVRTARVVIASTRALSGEPGFQLSKHCSVCSISAIARRACPAGSGDSCGNSARISFTYAVTGCGVDASVGTTLASDPLSVIGIDTVCRAWFAPSATGVG